MVKIDELDSRAESGSATFSKKLCETIWPESNSYDSGDLDPRVCQMRLTNCFTMIASK